MLSWDELNPVLDELSDAIDSYDHERRLRKLLIQIVPGFKTQCEISDVLYNGRQPG